MLCQMTNFYYVSFLSIPSAVGVNSIQLSDHIFFNCLFLLYLHSFIDLFFCLENIIVLLSVIFKALSLILGWQ